MSEQFTNIMCKTKYSITVWRERPGHILQSPYRYRNEQQNIWLTLTCCFFLWLINPPVTGSFYLQLFIITFVQWASRRMTPTGVHWKCSGDIYTHWQKSGTYLYTHALKIGSYQANSPNFHIYIGQVIILLSFKVRLCFTEIHYL